MWENQLWQFLKADLWWENWVVSFLHFHLTGGCVHLDFCLICESCIIENILQILKRNCFRRARGAFTEAIKNISQL